jgi:hypothetical protein
VVVLVTPYKTGAPLYLQAGWAGVIPLPPKKKSSPPTGYTGWNGKDPSPKMIEMWSNETTGDYQAASNIAIHMPDGVVGVDVDNYGNKHGIATLNELMLKLWPLPATYMSTSKYDPNKSFSTQSGIRWFRVEPGLRWPSGPGKDIEFIHIGHRYAVVWPSIHPNGQQYKWYDYVGHECEPPEIDQLSWMPDEWQIKFTGGETYTPGPAADPDPTQNELSECLTDGAICYATAKALAKFEDRKTVQARHDSMRDTAMAIVRLGEQGHKGTLLAIQQLRETFIKLVAPDRSDGSEGAEFQRALNGAIVKVLAAPTAEQNKGCCGQTKQAQISKLLPEEFWNSRGALRHIRQAAHSRGRCPDVALYTVLVRVASMVSPLLKFENCLGDGSLFAAVIGSSGGGKSTGTKVGKRLVPVPTDLARGDAYRDSIPLGSGEGLAELYMGTRNEPTGEVYGPRANKAGQPKTVPVRSKVRDNAFLYVDEGQSLIQQGKRQGNIVLPSIRTAWDGGTLGQANAREETTRHIPDGSYSMGLVIGFQENTVQELLADATAGTPQRFIWCWATDPAVPDERPEWPGTLNIDRRTRTITFCQEINDELWREDLAKNRGQLEVPELDSQKSKMLCKLSALVCVIDGRRHHGPLEPSQGHVRHQFRGVGTPDRVRPGRRGRQTGRLRRPARHTGSASALRQNHGRQQRAPHRGTHLQARRGAGGAHSGCAPQAAGRAGQAVFL